MKKTITALVLAVFLAGGVLLGFLQIKPNARPSDAESDAGFSRVLEDIAQITTVPHSAGSKENQAVQKLITDRGTALGLEAEVQPFRLDVNDILESYRERYETGTDAYRKRMDDDVKKGNFASLDDMVRGRLGAGESDEYLQLNNLMFRVEGDTPEGAAMFVSHYDSVGTAPGAADDALAVACMLELMDRVAAGQKPPADIYFLFTDGEEQRLLGAKHFVEAYPQYVEKTGVLFNFEARGNSGAMLMFETSANNGDLLRVFSRAVPQPVTFSVATAIYEQMPNGTDFTPLKNAGYKGLNFAMIEGDETYHQPTDTVENLNKDTAWQYYQTVTSLGESVQRGDFIDVSHEKDAVFFPFSLLGIVVIPGMAARVLGFLPLVLAVLLLVLDAAKKRLKVSRTIGVLVMGLIPAAVTLFFFPASYLFFLPAALFLLGDLCFTISNKPAGKVLGTALFALALLTAGLLFLPIVYLIQIALKLWYVTALFALLPLIPAVFYSAKSLQK